VGAYTASPSYYGTFDQGGNAMEWNEALISGGNRGVRGGAWTSDFFPLQSGISGYNTASDEQGYGGFRLASIPEPVPGALLLTAAGFTLRRMRRGGRSMRLRGVVDIVLSAATPSVSTAAFGHGS
jgi:hypothetical protein